MAGPQTATVALTVLAVNDAPVAAADGFALPAVGPFVVPAGAGLLANDSDVDGDPITATLIDPPAVGTLTLNPDGSFAYAFPDDLFDVVTFTYAAADGHGTGPPATVTLRRGSSVTVVGGSVQILGSPGTDVVRVRKAPRNGLRVELFTPDAVIRTTVWPEAGFKRFELADVYLAAGDDRLDAVGLLVPVRAVGGPGSDLLRSGARADLLFGDQTNGSGAGDDVVEAGAGNDVVHAGGGRDVIDAGSGRDSVTAGPGGSVIEAGPGNDVVTVAGGRNWVSGAGGNDVLVGGAGDDWLEGGAGRDLLVGGLGADRLEGGGGPDLLFDGSVALVSPDTDSLVAVLASYRPTTLGRAGVSARLAVTFDTGWADTLTGGAGADWFWSSDPLDALDLVGGETLNTGS